MTSVDIMLTWLSESVFQHFQKVPVSKRFNAMTSLGITETVRDYNYPTKGNHLKVKHIKREYNTLLGMWQDEMVRIRLNLL